MPVQVGTSGWQYRHWRGDFYPTGLPQRGWLGYYAERFATVELNNSFYRLAGPETFQQWREHTPADFRVAVKMSRYLTHIKRLRDPAEPVERFLTSATALGPKLGPVLLQLPPTLQCDEAALAATLARFPARVRVAVEFRHPSWFTPAIAELLTRHDAATCLWDWSGRRAPMWRTSSWGYLRLHQGRARPRPCYGRQALRSWAERLAGQWAAADELWVYFNNDTSGCAPRNALTFAAELTRVGLAPTRVAAGAPADGVPAVGVPAVGVPAVGVPAVGVPAVGAPAAGAARSGD